MEPERQKYPCCFSCVLSPGKHRFNLEDKHQTQQEHDHFQGPTLDDWTIIDGWAWGR